MTRIQEKDVITILTDPIPPLSQYYKEKIKIFLRPILRKIDGKQPLKKIKYGGHYAVTRSLVEGLQKANIPFIYNPQKVKLCSNRVVVLSGIETLKQALVLKESGKIHMLAAGPNLVIMPSDYPEIIGNKLIDKFILNSNWIKNAFCTEMPHLLPYTIIWPAGVNESYWKPESTHKTKNKILFYSKRPDRNLYMRCIDIATKKGLEVTEIIYGKYTSDQFKNLLNQCSILIHFVEQESQGISLLESWAMDKPTIVWNPGTYFLKGKTVVSSSAPYLSADTGMFFKDANGFDECINQVISGITIFNPREWVLKNMTDEKAAINLIQQLSF